MSLYNMVFGHNNFAPVVMALLAPIDPGRLRDAWVEKLPDGTLRLAVYTRNGGGNREHYDDDKEGGHGCECTGCIMTFVLPEHPLYISDQDDDYDCTYATIYFRLPKDLEKRLRDMGAPDDTDFTLQSYAREVVDTSERWHQALAAIANPKAGT